jgi:type IV pilus assembly protein PilY1
MHTKTLASVVGGLLLLSSVGARAQSTTPAGPPNILIVLDTSTSMKWWPIAWRNDVDWYTTPPTTTPPIPAQPARWTSGYYSYSMNNNPNVGPLGEPLTTPSLPGCRQEDVNALGYDPAVIYPQLLKDIGNTSTAPKVRNTEYFNTTTYYYIEGKGDQYPTLESSGSKQVSFGMSFFPVPFHGVPSGIKHTDVSAACKKVYSDSSTAVLPQGVLDACTQCLQTKGYFQYAEGRRVAVGNFLNFYSPRGHTAVSALSQVLEASPGVRFSLMSFSHGDANHTALPNKKVWPMGQAIYFPVAHDAGITRLNAFGPSCAQASDADSLQAHRNTLIQSLKSLAFNVATPLTESLYASGHYFRNAQGPTEPWASLGSFPTNAGFNDEAAPGVASVCFDCGFNAVILLADSAPVEWGTPAAPAAIRNLPTPCNGCGTYAAPSTHVGGGSKTHVHRVADFLWNNDQRTDLPGMQRVATYTVGLATQNMAPEAINLLKATAQAGGGLYLQATNTNQLRDALFTIVADVQNRNTFCGVEPGPVQP